MEIGFLFFFCNSIKGYLIEGFGEVKVFHAFKADNTKECLWLWFLKASWRFLLFARPVNYHNLQLLTQFTFVFKYIWRIPWSRSSRWFPFSYHWVSPTPYLAHGNSRTWTGSKAITGSNSTFMTRSVSIRMLSTTCSSVSVSIFCIKLVFHKMLWKYWSKMAMRVTQNKGITQSAVIKRRPWRARSWILWSTCSSLQLRMTCWSSSTLKERNCSSSHESRSCTWQASSVSGSWTTCFGRRHHTQSSSSKTQKSPHSATENCKQNMLQTTWTK